MLSKTILFDLGNVILNFDHGIATKKIAKFTDKSSDEIYKIVFESEIIRDFEKGKLAPDDFFADFKKILNIKNLNFFEFLPIWNEIFFENKEVVDIIRALKENTYRIVIITNVNSLHLDYVMSHFDILNEVDKIIPSCEVGYRKPHPQIYQIAIDYAKEKPQKLLYIDDLPQLVQGARLAGLCAIQFKDADQLRRDLINYNISCLTRDKKFDK